MTENGSHHDPMKFKSLDQILPLFEPTLQKSISHSLDIIEEAFTRYGDNYFCLRLTEEISQFISSASGLSISYNGGKDSCVLLHLL